MIHKIGAKFPAPEASPGTFAAVVVDGSMVTWGKPLTFGRNFILEPIGCFKGSSRAFLKGI